MLPNFTVVIRLAKTYIIQVVTPETGDKLAAKQLSQVGPAYRQRTKFEMHESGRERDDLGVQVEPAQQISTVGGFAPKQVTRVP